MGIIAVLTILSLLYLIGVFTFLYHKDKKRRQIHKEHEVIIAKRKELFETDEEEYKLFKDYSDKKMNEDYKNL